MRLPQISDNELTPTQRVIQDEATAGKRGHVPAPLRAWIHSAEMGRHANRLGAFVRYDTQFPPNLSELAILVTARCWNSNFEWYAHKGHALKAGVDPAIIDAIDARRPPEFQKPDEEMVYTFAKTLFETKTIPSDLYDKAQKMFGDKGVVELVGILGYYGLVAMTLNTFDYTIPPGEAPLKP